VTGVRRVALFRGINVGKAKRIAMADLRKVAEGLGYTDVRTLLNSGNLVFTVPRAGKADPGPRIEKAVEQQLGVRSRVTILTGDEIAEIAARNPFGKVADNHSRLLVMVLSDAELHGVVAGHAKRDWGEERIAMGKRAVYAWCPDSILDSPLFKQLSRAVGDGATTRNFATMLKLHALCTDTE
jgi:uncharacterized protein (DUF1697 family)